MTFLQTQIKWQNNSRLLENNKNRIKHRILKH